MIFFTMFSEASCIRFRVTVNNGGPLDSRLLWEVFVFILTYSQHSFIQHSHSENNILSVQGNYLPKISKSNHFGIMLFFKTSDCTFQRWTTWVNRQRFYKTRIYLSLHTLLRGLSLVQRIQSVIYYICSLINMLSIRK